MVARKGVTNLYATVVNGRYVLRALSLYQSLVPNLEGKLFAVYCVDDTAADLLEPLHLDRHVVVRPHEFETEHLLSLKRKRTISEYCWTCKPVVLEHAFARFPDLKWGIYLDSDMMAFEDPDSGLPDRDDAQVVITPHRPSNDYFAQFINSAGFYNAGYAAFRNTEEGRVALKWWRDRCHDDCPSTPRNGAYADQRYLNDLPNLFPSVVSSSHPGLNAGPWNIIGQSVSLRDGHAYVADSPLLLYHMQGFQILGGRLFDLYSGPVRMPYEVRSIIYRPYQKCVVEACKELQAAHDGFRQQPDLRFWRPMAVLRELRKWIKGNSNLSYCV